MLIVGDLKALPEAETEGAVVDSAANLQQKIGIMASPAYLLRLVHPAVYQEIVLCDRAIRPIIPKLVDQNLWMGRERWLARTSPWVIGSGP
ncbi:conserved protein of unknown function [Rhodovastum atsumiense]|uniref:Uncharacterized protein n=1 Tax=Rhodovastum atsumiense TaxID=504468 RepID=A0A5M6IIS5_9PROT|nr:hypothetical protein [Rhodovastum atsumiense]KAA5608052.1 hypothetical protein F1189_30935 [Rhodovastum atsumiense]CAH2603462.1 conserved protein of unknown function [Rhodovastum atsumiense]